MPAGGVRKQACRTARETGNTEPMESEGQRGTISPDSSLLGSDPVEQHCDQMIWNVKQQSGGQADVLRLLKGEHRCGGALHLFLEDPSSGLFFFSISR